MLYIELNTIFFTAGDSRDPELAGIRGAAVGSLYTLLVTVALSCSFLGRRVTHLARSASCFW